MKTFFTPLPMSEALPLILAKLLTNDLFNGKVIADVGKVASMVKGAETGPKPMFPNVSLAAKRSMTFLFVIIGTVHEKAPLFGRFAAPIEKVAPLSVEYCNVSGLFFACAKKEIFA